jgi:haloalkane dehalogenase
VTGDAAKQGVDRAAYPFRSRWHVLPQGRGRMHYVDEGEGETVLFVHGTPTWSFEWRHLIRSLSAGRRTVAPDHLGFGLSDRPADFVYTPEAHAANLAHFADALGLDGYTLVVHDYGGPIGLPLALEHPERVRRLVLINTWMWSFADDRELVRRARLAGGPFGRFLYRRANASLRLLMPSAYGDRSKLTRDVHEQYLRRFPDAWSRGAVLWPLAHALLGSDAFYRSLWQRRDRLRGRPALLLWGMKDSAFRPHQLARWREVLPQAEVVALDASGHWPHEEEPQRVTDALRGFLMRPMNAPAQPD